MIKIEKINEKIELLDVEIQSEPCKMYFDKQHIRGKYDCMHDCIDGNGHANKYGSDAY